MKTKQIAALDGDAILVDHWAHKSGKDAVCLYVRHGRATVIVAVTKDQARELAAALLEAAE
jgi:hypothetical protein